MISPGILRFIVVVCGLLLSCVSQDQQPIPSSGQRERAVQEFLRNYLKDDLVYDPDIRYLVEFFDLNGDKKQEAIVYVLGEHICGKVGCPTIILTPQDSGYKLVTEMSSANLPIRVLDTSSRGWRDLEVRVVPGSSLEDYEALLRFDGVSYPKIPSVAPAQRNDGKIPGHRLFDSAEEKRLVDK